MLVFSTFLPNTGKKVLLYSLQIVEILFTIFVWQKKKNAIFKKYFESKKILYQMYFLRDYVAEVSVPSISGKCYQTPS